MDKLTLALDLEDCLITPLVKANVYKMEPGPFHPRPGLLDFLAWAGERYTLAVFTGVPSKMALRVLDILVAGGHAPQGFNRIAVTLARDPSGNARPPKRFGDPDGRQKDLARLGPLGTVMILDDNPEGYAVPGQEAFWIKIPGIPRKMGVPTGDNDLVAIRPDIEALATRLASVSPAPSR